jgi:hypothetical protein
MVEKVEVWERLAIGAKKQELEKEGVGCRADGRVAPQLSNGNRSGVNIHIVADPVFSEKLGRLKG